MFQRILVGIDGSAKAARALADPQRSAGFDRPTERVTEHAPCPVPVVR